VLVLLTTGHFAGGVGAAGFIERHRHDLIPRTAAAITVEHCGAMDWEPQPDGSTKPTGKPDFGGIFGPPNTAIADASLAMLRRAEAAPALVMRPLEENPGPGQPAWPGEGQYLWADGGIPTANYITGPSYLLNWGVDAAARIDFARMRREAMSFTEMTIQLSRVPRNKLREINNPA
jgi:hypothetical protein